MLTAAKRIVKIRHTCVTRYYMLSRKYSNVSNFRWLAFVFNQSNLSALTVDQNIYERLKRALILIWQCKTTQRFSARTFFTRQTNNTLIFFPHISLFAPHPCLNASGHIQNAHSVWSFLLATTLQITFSYSQSRLWVTQNLYCFSP